MNVRFKARLPWALAFSFARAIQQPAMEIWLGHEGNVYAAQQALTHRASCNRAARLGEYSPAMENMRSHYAVPTGSTFAVAFVGDDALLKAPGVTGASEGTQWSGSKSVGALPGSDGRL
jgi:hypothetical protein